MVTVILLTTLKVVGMLVTAVMIHAYHMVLMELLHTTVVNLVLVMGHVIPLVDV